MLLQRIHYQMIIRVLFAIFQKPENRTLFSDGWRFQSANGSLGYELVDSSFAIFHSAFCRKIPRQKNNSLPFGKLLCINNHYDF